MKNNYLMRHDVDSYNFQFDELCKKLNLGSLIAIPKSLTGGHMHKMFMLETTSGKYAVKALNPSIMRRPEAMKNLISAENIAQIAAKHISAAPSLMFKNSFMQEVDHQYYYLFRWINGKTLLSNDLTVEHSAIMGKLLAKLHNIDFSSLNLIDDYSYKESAFNWDFYLQRGIECNTTWANLIKENRDNLYIWNKTLIESSAKLSTDTIISHGDLEPKNVMWENERPIIIDWEAAGFVHPAYDLFETALYWAKDNNDNIQKDRFMAFIYSYKEINPQLKMDYDAIFGKGFVRLGWLDYSLKRSLGIECSDESEKQMGTDHVFWSIKDLLHYEKIIAILKEWLIEADT